MTNFDVVKKLIGPINPVGESNTDAERLENLKAMCALMEEIYDAIDEVSFKHRGSHEYSVRQCGDYASQFLYQQRQR